MLSWFFYFTFRLYRFFFFLYNIHNIIKIKKVIKKKESLACLFLDNIWHNFSQWHIIWYLIWRAHYFWKNNFLLYCWLVWPRYFIMDFTFYNSVDMRISVIPIIQSFFILLSSSTSSIPSIFNVSFNYNVFHWKYKHMHWKIKNCIYK